MNFGLITKYSAIDFETVNLADLLLIGGGCGETGGGASSVSVQSVQAAAQSAAMAPGANPTASATVAVTATGNTYISFAYGQGGRTVGVAEVLGQSVVASGSSSGYGNPTLWVNVGGFFSWLFGSH